MRFINTTGGVGLAWNQYAGLRTKEKGKEPHYGGENKLAHDGLREALARRQGFLCGFCMSHLDCRDKDGNLTWHKVKVAHLQAQSLSKKQKAALTEAALEKEIERRRKLGIDHTNMVLACQGNIGGAIHCDAHQKEGDIKHIRFNNQGLMDQVTFPPMRVLEDATPFNRTPTKTAPGLLVKGPEDWQAEIGALLPQDDPTSLLNLNNKVLCRRRQEAVDNLLFQLKKGNDYNPANYQRWINYYSTPDATGRLPVAYCQVMIRVLQKKIQQHT